MLNKIFITWSLSIDYFNKIKTPNKHLHSMNSYSFNLCKLLFTVTFSFLLSLYASIANALPEDSEQPINVTSNNAKLDEKSGITTLTGNVKITQGTMNIAANILVIYRDKSGDINKMIATGKPAFFSQQQQKDQPVSKAWGNKMNYSIVKQTLTITENARVEQLKDKFTGQQIVYHMDEAIVEATGGKERVQMIIQPKGKQ